LFFTLHFNSKSSLISHQEILFLLGSAELDSVSCIQRSQMTPWLFIISEGIFC
jgi:hypothetical protein